MSLALQPHHLYVCSYFVIYCFITFYWDSIACVWECLFVCVLLSLSFGGRGRVVITSISIRIGV